MGKDRQPSPHGGGRAEIERKKRRRRKWRKNPCGNAAIFNGEGGGKPIKGAYRVTNCRISATRDVSKVLKRKRGEPLQSTSDTLN